MTNENDNQINDITESPVEAQHVEHLTLKKSIKTKIRNTFIISIASLMAVGAAGLYSSSQLGRSVNDLNKNVIALKRQGIIDMNHNAFYGEALNLITIIRSDESLATKKEEITAAENAISERKKDTLALLDTNIADDFDKDISDLSKDIKPYFEEYIKHIETIERLSEEYIALKDDADVVNAQRLKVDEMLKVYKDDFKPYFYLIEEKGDLLYQAFERKGSEINTNSEKIKNTATVTQLTIFTVALMLLAFLISGLFSSIKTKIANILGLISSIKENNLDIEYTDKEDDEFRTIGDALTVTASDLKIAQSTAKDLYDKAESENKELNDSIVDLLGTMFEFTKKNLAVRAEVKENVVGTIADSINMVIGSTAKALDETSTVAGMVESASTESQEKSTHLYQLSQKSKDVVEAVLGDFKQSLEEIQTISKVAKESQRAADLATNSTMEALNIVKQTVGSMGSIRDTISNTETKIKKLAERSQEIGFIVDLIGDISERTHVLSLNAAIQAAVAGDAGRGFAAIAGEIQKLAESTKEATQKISRLVNNIQVETGETIQMVNTTIDKVVNGVKLAESSGNQMIETQSKTEELAKTVMQISNSIDQHAQVTIKLQDNAKSLGDAQEEFSSAAQDQLMQARSLLAFARKLKESVEEFKTA